MKWNLIFANEFQNMILYIVFYIQFEIEKFSLKTLKKL